MPDLARLRYGRRLASLGCVLAVMGASCTSASSQRGESLPATTTTSVAPSSVPAATTVSAATDPTTVAPSHVVGHTLVNPCGSGAVMEPTSIVLACADGNAQIVHLAWSSWTSTEARATGDYAVNDCTPTCVGGKFHQYPATIILGDVETGGGTWYFTTLTVVPTGESPFGSPSREFPILS